MEFARIDPNGNSLLTDWPITGCTLRFEAHRFEAF
jgi:hypothetical protein